MLNNSKSSVNPLFIQLEALPSTANKAYCFSRKFSSTSIVDSSGVTLSDFDARKDYLLRHMYITPSMFSVMLSKLDRNNACSFSGISRIVLNKCALDLARVTSKF